MDSLIVPLRDLDRSMLPQGGGKAVNLGELIRAGLPVPPGVCLTTEAYRRGAVVVADLVEQLAAAEPNQQAAIAEQIREQFVNAPLPEEVSQAIREGIRDLGEATKVAVRSSATAEDLPFASFAGQQDTILNVVGTDAVLEAVRRCWASLWTQRAVVYRANNGIDQRTVHLAVVIQQMVDASAAGVLFTADPLTGNRFRAVVEATSGLGEALVSGAVNPDHWLVDTATARVVEGPTEGCISEAQVLELTRLGERVERHFGAPQDIEFAFDQSGKAWLVQSRAITTLYPLPAGAPADPANLRVYVSFNVFQGVFRPLTPMGIDAFRLLGIGMARIVGVERTTPLLIEAGGRLFVDLTAAIRSTFFRRVVRAALGQGEARSGVLIDALASDPRLSPKPVNRRAVARAFAHAMRRTRLPLAVLAAWLWPRRAHRSMARLRRQLYDPPLPAPGATAEQVLDAAEDLLRSWPPAVVPRLAPMLFGGVGAFALAYAVGGKSASREDFDAVRRALPHNPTTEMDLALWQLASAVRADSAARSALAERSAEQLAAEYAERTLPPVLQRGLAAFLAEYGHRAIAEIDLGLPRWSEDPTPLLAHLANYLELDQAAASPAQQFDAAAREAEVALQSIVRQAARRGALRARVVGFLLRRGRALGGYREMPKFVVVLMLAQARALLLRVGEELVRRQRLAHRDDIFFLTVDEARAALAGAAMQPVVEERRSRYREEMRRRHVPRLLLSDGTEPRPPADEAAGLDGQVLRGTPASAGKVEGRARVILDPAGARLSPGEILVAPSTDPGWTPLFLTAGGLVMEMGGAMSHGAVVAREYGIPAVVGVPLATERIADGEQIAVDGSSGTVARSAA